MSKSAIVVAVIVSFGLAGCATTSKASGSEGATAQIKKRAAFDLSCPEDQLEVTQLQKGGLTQAASYGVKGCDQQVTYLERAGTIIKQ